MDFYLYLIGEKNLFKDDESYLEALERCFSSGIEAFQLRQKDVSDKVFIELGLKIKSLLAKYPRVKFFVNDRVDAALALGAYGVHLNKNSIPVKEVKNKINNLKIFYSSHSVEESIRAEEEGADFIAFSPVFKTKGLEFGQGVDALRAAVESVSVPVFALGGINEGNAAELFNSGCSHIAVQSAILKRDDIEAAVKGLINAFKFQINAY